MDPQFVFFCGTFLLGAILTGVGIIATDVKKIHNTLSDIKELHKEIQDSLTESQSIHDTVTEILTILERRGGNFEESL